MNDIIDNIVTRRSIRGFKDIPISTEDMNTIIDAGMLAPCGFVKDKRLFTGILNKNVILHINSEIQRALISLKNSDISNAHLLKLIDKAEDSNVNFFNGGKSIVIVSTDKDDEYGESTCAVGLENMMLAANSIDIDSCWLNQLTRLQNTNIIMELKEELSIPHKNKIYGTIVLGYRNIEPPANRSALYNSKKVIIE